MKGRIVALAAAILFAASGAWLLSSTIFVESRSRLKETCEFHDLGEAGLKLLVRGLDGHSDGGCDTSKNGPYIIFILPIHKEYNVLGSIDDRAFELKNPEKYLRDVVSGPEEMAQMRFFPGGVARPLYSSSKTAPYYACHGTCIVAYTLDRYAIVVTWRIEDGGSDVEAVARHSQEVSQRIIRHRHG